MIKKIVYFITTSISILSCSNDDNNSLDTRLSQSSEQISRSFYQEVVVNKNMSLFNQYIGTVYIQHTPTIADGVEAFKINLETNISGDNNVKILRVVGDKNYAALHSLWTIDSQQYVFADIWRVDNGKLVEHWSQSQKISDNPMNTNTMYSGPDTNLNANQNIEQNKSRAIKVLNVFGNLDDLTPVDNFVSPNYIQHNPTVKDGKQGFIDLLNSLRDINYKANIKIAKILAFGDMVFVHSSTTDLTSEGNDVTGGVDIFRFDNNGQIVEHWDVLEPMTSNSLNNNDPFYYPN